MCFNSLAGGSGIHRPLGGREELGADYKAKVKFLFLLLLLNSTVLLNS